MILFEQMLDDIAPANLCSCATCLTFGDEVSRELVKEEQERWRRLDEEARREWEEEPVRGWQTEANETFERSR